ncbi:hypothetical protein ACL9RF_07480 [Sphingobacterium sp. Mn56C]|uniref:hypothetical protein n=1 Tax=Sphingobacterium sp. Mn56C TaxID=3395261 RepID=UPI003BC6B931
MRNTLIITALLFIAVIAASIYYFSDVNKDQTDSARALKYLPENTLLITSIRNDQITDNIFKDFEIFDAILGFQEAQTNTLFKQSLLRHDALKNYVDNADIYVSFHPEGKTISTLFTVPTQVSLKESDLSTVLAALGRDVKIETTDTLNTKLYTLHFEQQNSRLYAVYYQDIIFASTSKPILATIVDKHAVHLPKEQLDYFAKNSSRNTPFSVFFPHQQFPAFVQQFQERTKGIFLDQFAGLKGQSAWNINFKQDALMLTGESEITETQDSYLAIFSRQRKTTQQLYNYFPANTAVYMEYSFRDSKTFQQDLNTLFQNRKESDRINNTWKEIGDSAKTVEKLNASWGSNFALIETQDQNHMGFVAIQDSAAWETVRSTILENVGDSIYRFKNSQLLYAQYGDAFKTLNRPYVTQVANVLVIANSSSTLQSYLTDWRKKSLLVGTLGFKNFEKLQGNDANITLFVHNRNAQYKILNSLPQAYQKKFKDKDNYGYQDFYSWSVQLSGNNGSLSSQIYAVYKSKSALGGTPEWVYPMENKAITRPYVFDHSDTSQFILIQELDHTVHAISTSGEKLWSAVFAGRVTGDIQQLPDRSLLLVTDKAQLYRFDTDGKAFKGFSATIPDVPTATATITQINGISCILVPTAKKVYAFDMEGQRLKDWKTVEVDGRINGPVQIAGEHFAIGTTYGRVYLLDQRGEKYREIDVPGDVEFNGPIGFWDKGNKEYQYFATDGKSNFYRIPEQEPTTKMRLENTATASISAFENLNGNSMPELVHLSKGELQVYDIADSLHRLFTYNFTKGVEDRPQFFPNAGSPTPFLGVAVKASNLIYLFHIGDQMLVEGFPLEAQPLFYYGKISPTSDNYLLCMRRDHKLYAFRHKK